MNSTLKILFVEDIIRDAELNWREIERNGIAFKKLLVDNKKDFLEGLKSFKPDIIISDYSLPQFDGMQALLLRNELAPQTPFIVVTGSVNEEVAVECMKAGADDYVIKEHLTRLPFAIKEALEQHTILIEKRAAELLLKENEEKLQSIFSAAPVGIGLVVDRVLIEVNDTFLKMTGYDRKELIGKSSAIIYATTKEYESAGFEKYRQISEKGAGSVETRFKCKNGKILNIQLSSAPLDKNDLTKGVTFTAMDITDRIHAEKELHIALTKYKTLFDNLPMGVTVSDEMGNILETNPIAEKLLNLSPDEQKQRSIDGLDWQIVRTDGTPMPPEEYASVRAMKENRLVENVEMGIVKSNNIFTWINVTAAPLPLKGYGVIIAYNNITKRKLAEDAIIQERSVLRTLIDNLPNQIYIKDFDCRKVIANKADVKNIGFEKEAEVLGKTDIELFPGQTGQRGYDDDKQVIRSGNGIFNREEDFVDSMGVRRWLLTSKIPLHDMDGKITGLVGIGHDITERKLIMEDLIKAKEKAEESDRLKTAFLNNISHEIRTPLNGILGFGEFLLKPDLHEETKKLYYGILKSSSERLVNTITNFMDISMIVSGNIVPKLARIDLMHLIDEIYINFYQKCKDKNLELIKQIPSSGNTFINCDYILVEKVLSNLLDNAIKFTSKGQITIGFQPTDGEIELFVSDTGTGIELLSQKTVFEVFRQEDASATRGYEGSGLGLSIAKGLVELMGGEIRIKSAKGIGSEFYIMFPGGNAVTVKTELPFGFNTKSTDKIETGRKNHRSPVILIAEDDESNSIFLKILLEENSCDSLQAYNGSEALEMCRSHPEISLVLMDIKMPVMDGLEATRKIKEFRKSLPVIGITAYAMTGDREKVFEAGCDEYLTKPVKRELLLSTIKKQLSIY